MLLHLNNQVTSETKLPEPLMAVNVGSMPTTTGLQFKLLFVTCRVLVKAPDGLSV